MARKTASSSTETSTEPAEPTGSAARRARNRRRADAREHARVRARPILPGTRYLVTRRCHDRWLMMVPDDKRRELIQLLGYTLALCLKRYGLQLHAAVFLSNHYHLVVTDTRGQLPAFKSMFNALVARSVNALRGRHDTFWSGDATCDVTLESDDRVLSRMAYTLANPTEAELVKWGHRWPGLTTYKLAFGAKKTFRRPKTFFDGDNSRLPATLDLELVRPEIFSKLTDEELHARLHEEVHVREVEKQEAMDKEGRRFLGEKKVQRQRWNRPPRAPTDRFGPRPKVSEGNKWVRIAALQRNKHWERAYAEARDAFRAGQREVEFPHGTWWMQHHVGVKVATAPA